jgi:hypothetical protein
MMEIVLPRSASGKELTDVVRNIAADMDFKFYNNETGISIERGFPEHVPEEYRLSFDTTPYFDIRLGIIDPEKIYAFITARTMLGTMRMQDVDLEEIDEGEFYKPFYDRFCEELKTKLK